MRSRRSWMLFAATATVALVVATLPALAAELFGTVKTVKPEEKAIIVVEEESGEEVEVTLSDSTVVINARGKRAKSFDLAKFKRREGKARVTVEHEDGVASKITLSPARKDGDGGR